MPSLPPVILATCIPSLEGLVLQRASLLSDLQLISISEQLLLYVSQLFRTHDERVCRDKLTHKLHQLYHLVHRNGNYVQREHTYLQRTLIFLPWQYISNAPPSPSLPPSPVNSNKHMSTLFISFYYLEWKF